MTGDACVKMQDNLDILTPEEASVFRVTSEHKTVTILQPCGLDLIDDAKTLQFFLLDIIENVKKRDSVFLIGKVFHEDTNSYVSCCVEVFDIETCCFFLRRLTEKNTKNVVTDDALCNEISSVLNSFKITQFQQEKVIKKNCFEPSIPVHQDEYIEVRYSRKFPSLPKNLEGNTFWRVFGTTQTRLETLILEHKIKSLCWLEITNAIPSQLAPSWCKIQVECSVSDITVMATSLKKPPLIVAAIKVKRSENKLAALACAIHDSYEIDNSPSNTQVFHKHFCLIALHGNVTNLSNFFHMKQNYKLTEIRKFDGEKAILNNFIRDMAKYDCDVIVGHDLQALEIPFLAERMAALNVQEFSKLGRIRNIILFSNNPFVGRIICDVKVACRQLIKSRSYDLDGLYKSIFKVAVKNVEVEETENIFNTTENIFKAVTVAMRGCCYAFKIMNKLDILAVASTLSSVSGATISRILTWFANERTEYFLMQELHERNFLIPDKVSIRKKDPSDTFEGGLVLEPEIGLFRDYVLLLDFATMYSSVIQEFELCFSHNVEFYVLPFAIKKLLDVRNNSKSVFTKTAIKLMANSIYGCLGYKNSRFYNKELAASIAARGRTILQDTRKYIEENNFRVIYGDTDSLMVRTNQTDYTQAKKIADEIIEELNKKFSFMQLKLDEIFCSLLIIKKKKYAGIAQNDNNGKIFKFVGLEMARGDWTELASKAAKFALENILSEQLLHESFHKITMYLEQVQEKLQFGEVSLTDLLIRKELVRNPNEYVNKNMPHVQVALRGNYKRGETVSYIIANDYNGYTLAEFRKKSNLTMDVDYYMKKQVLAVVKRLCEPIKDLGPIILNEFKPLNVVVLDGVVLKGVEKFVFPCFVCGKRIIIEGTFVETVNALEKCKKCGGSFVDRFGAILHRLLQFLKAQTGNEDALLKTAIYLNSSFKKIEGVTINSNFAINLHRLWMRVDEWSRLKLGNSLIVETQLFTPFKTCANQEFFTQDSICQLLYLFHKD